MNRRRLKLTFPHEKAGKRKLIYADAGYHKEQTSQRERVGESELISGHDDGLLNTCGFLLIYCLLTAEVF